MTDINPKGIKTKAVQVAYDLAMAYCQQNPDAVPGDATPDDYSASRLNEVLNELGWQRAANVSAILKSHVAALASGKSTPVAASDASEDAIALAHKAVGRPINAAPVSAPAPAAPEGADRVKMPIVSPTSEALIDTTLTATTGGATTSIADLLAAKVAAEQAAAKTAANIAAHQAAIAAYKSGAEDVDEAGIEGSLAFTASGFANLPTDGDMVPVLDKMLADGLSETITFAEIVGAIQRSEAAVQSGTHDLKALARELRAARPKKRVAAPAATASMQSSEAESLDDINTSCQVVMETAADLFPRCFGANPQVLQFEVPKLEFDQPHPLVPAIDDSFQFNTRVAVEALYAMAENEIIWIYGDSGCGKSDFCVQLAAHLGMPFTQMNLDGHLPRPAIVRVNRLMPDENGQPTMRFVEGILPRAMRRPGLLLIDEFDLGDPEIMPIFQPILERKPLVLLEDGARIVKPHPLFRIIITGNTVGLGSENQMYMNAFEQSAATRDRIASFVNMPYMPADVEEKVVLQRLPNADPDFVRKLIQLANKVRDGYRQGDIQTLFSSRAVQYCAKRHTRLASLYPSSEEAAQDILETVIMNRLDPASTQAVKGLIDNIF